MDLTVHTYTHKQFFLVVESDWLIRVLILESNTSPTAASPYRITPLAEVTMRNTASVMADAHIYHNFKNNTVLSHGM